MFALVLNQLPVPYAASTSLRVASGCSTWSLFVLFSGLYASALDILFRRRQTHFQAFGNVDVLCRLSDGLATIINGFLAFGPSVFGHAAPPIAHGLWWIDVAMSPASGLVIPFLMFTSQEHGIEKMTAVRLCYRWWRPKSRRQAVLNSFGDWSIRRKRSCC